MRNFWLLAVFILWAGSSAANTISYQGQLQQDGEPFSGSADLSFQLFDEADHGNPIGAVLTRPNWPVTEGLFQVDLDFGPSAFDGSPRYLQVTVNGVPLSPRQAVTAAPQALIANTTIAGAIGSTQINPTEVQRRITGSCAEGDAPLRSYVQRILADGTVVCGRHAGQGTNSVIVGGGSNIASAFDAIVVGGTNNTASAVGAAIVGGIGNVAEATESFIGGGRGNRTSGNYSTISGGDSNQVTAFRGFVGGGEANAVDGRFGTIAGGSNNEATGDYSTISGGQENTSSGRASNIGGGSRSISAGNYSSIAGGSTNTAAGDESTISGGRENTTTGPESSIGGGRNNLAAGQGSRVGGGSRNTASGLYSTVTGGANNTASGNRSTVSAGSRNCAGAPYSWAGGRNAKIRPGSDSGDPGEGCAGVPPAGTFGDSGTFIWSGSQLADFVSSGSNQFLVRATGGAVITGSSSINNPEGNRLRVAGTLRVDSLGSGGSTSLCHNSADQIATCSSSERYKDQIEHFSGQEALAALALLRPVRYQWISSSRADIGLVAEEVAHILPEIVTYDDEGQIEGFEYNRLGPLLIAGFQEQTASNAERFAALEQDHQRLAAENAELRAAIAALTVQSGQVRELERRLAAIEEKEREQEGLQERLAALEALLLEARPALADSAH